MQIYISQIKMVLQIFDSDNEQVWEILVRQYFETKDLSAAIKFLELCTCTKNLVFPSSMLKPFSCGITL